MNTKIVGTLIASCLIVTAGAASGAAMSVNHRDKHFVRKFSMIGLEVERIGQLAQTQSQDAEVKELGRKLVQSYAEAGQQVAANAQAADVYGPTQISGRAARKVNKLAELSGAAFDQAALHELFKCEESGVRQLDMEAGNRGNVALRQSAALIQASTEPVLWLTAQLNAQFNGKT